MDNLDVGETVQWGLSINDYLEDFIGKGLPGCRLVAVLNDRENTSLRFGSIVYSAGDYFCDMKCFAETEEPHSMLLLDKDGNVITDIRLENNFIECFEPSLLESDGLALFSFFLDDHGRPAVMRASFSVYFPGKKTFHMFAMKPPSSQSAVWSSPVKMLIGMVIISHMILTGITRQHAATARMNLRMFHAAMNGKARRMTRQPSSFLLYPICCAFYLLFLLSSRAHAIEYTSPPRAPPMNVTRSDSMMFFFLCVNLYSLEPSWFTSL